MATSKPIRLKGVGVEVHGMKAFRKDIKKMQTAGGPDGRGLLKDANFRVAEHVRRKAVQRAAGVGRMQLVAALSMKSGKSQRAATITGGSAKVPFFAGAEFGAYRNKRRTIVGFQQSRLGWAQFKDWKKPGSGNTGYFLFPTMRAETKEIIEIWGREFDKISSEVFPDGR